jgi:solute:Na+ symporter, SSS family
VLSFGYWTTNFAEVQRALSAKSMNAARLTPIIGSWPKLLIPFVIIVPGLIASVIVRGIGAEDGDLTYNNAIPQLMDQLLPNGVLGIAMTGLLAAFMAGMAANVSSFNTVVTYDIIEPYIARGRPDEYYLRMGRIVTCAGVLVAIGTAFIASGYQNIMDYIQLLFSFFNAPLFATFIIALFWKRATPWAGVSGLAAGTLGAAAAHYAHTWGWIDLGTDQAAAFWGAAVAFISDAVVTVGVSLVTQPKPVEQLHGLVWSETPKEMRSPKRQGAEAAWFRSPAILGGGVLVSCLVLNFARG